MCVSKPVNQSHLYFSIILFLFFFFFFLAYMKLVIKKLILFVF
ncbi:hypothetical protein Patl1_07473 [Pistacia atlantica]|uniref:Uncharacterized protein n=1 Tax=Pistacia atlantica TaxID=434234 RepID=A0ACC1AK97_9ROSI|nr:hypothetical protein Patl1_07473 [Pistacia atlantica]